MVEGEKGGGGGEEGGEEDGEIEIGVLGGEERVEGV